MVDGRWSMPNNVISVRSPAEHYSLQARKALSSAHVLAHGHTATTTTTTTMCGGSSSMGPSVRSQLCVSGTRLAPVACMHGIIDHRIRVDRLVHMPTDPAPPIVDIDLDHASRGVGCRSSTAHCTGLTRSPQYKLSVQRSRLLQLVCLFRDRSPPKRRAQLRALRRGRTQRGLGRGQGCEAGLPRPRRGRGRRY